MVRRADQLQGVRAPRAAGLQSGSRPVAEYPRAPAQRRRRDREDNPRQLLQRNAAPCQSHCRCHALRTGTAPLTARPPIPRWLVLRSRMCSSRSCFSLTGLGASTIRSWPRCVFGKRDHFADRLGTGHQRHDAVKTEGNAAVRRRAVGQRIEQKAELGACVLRRDAQRREHLRLHFVAVDAHRAAADFPAVQRDVVGLGQHLAGIGRQQPDVLILGRRERMMRRDPALFFLVVLERREIHDPARPPAGFGVAFLVADL